MDPIKPIILIESASSHTLHDFLKEYFNIVVYDSTKTYNTQDLILINPYNKNDTWWRSLYNQGLRVIIDDLSEPVDWYTNSFEALAPGQYHVLTNINWFWYVEAEKILNNQQYTANKTYKKLALMPINYEKPHRQRLFDRMQPYLDNCVYSFADRGYYLPNDREDKTPPWDRHFNTDWYNDTYFTLAAESWTDHMQEVTARSNGLEAWHGPWPFVTEKTFKPIAHQHPFMIYGQSHTLAHLHSLGFETYENLFDESYDLIDNSNPYPIDAKLDIIINNVKNFEPRPYDALTLDKIQHNRNHYTNIELIRQRVKKEIIDPLLEYANKT